jgi:hypothetical protein
MSAKIATNLPHAGPVYSEEDLASDYDEEPAFRMKEVRQVMALVVGRRCHRFAQPILLLSLLGAGVAGMLLLSDLAKALKIVVSFWIEEPLLGLGYPRPSSHRFILLIPIHLLCTIVKMPMVELVLAV